MDRIAIGTLAQALHTTMVNDYKKAGNKHLKKAGPHAIEVGALALAMTTETICAAMHMPLEEFIELLRTARTHREAWRVHH